MNIFHPRNFVARLSAACALCMLAAAPPAQLARAQVATPAAAEAPGVAGQGAAGSWLGTLKVGAIELRLALEAREVDGTLTAELVSIDQGSARIPVTSISSDGKGVRFACAAIGFSYEGTFSADGAELAGTSTQGGRALPLTFRRQARAFALNRPQEPKKPYPYREEEVSIPDKPAGVTLAGTLTLPDEKTHGRGPFPAVVLMTGSGAQDRDEALMGHKPFLVLADRLTRAGIAVLRYDDRGFGKSTGNYAAATHFDFAADGRAAFQYLRARPEVDAKRVGLLGHSEGSVYAPYIAKDEKDVAFVVLLAGVGVPMDDLLFRQSVDIVRATGVRYVPTAQDIDDNKKIFALVRQKKFDEPSQQIIRDTMKASLARTPEEIRKAVGFDESMIENQLRMMMTPWFSELLAYDAARELPNIRAPVLALFGSKDLQVAAEPNAAAMKATFEKAGNRKVTIKTFDGLNHLFQHANTGAPSEYGVIEETMSPEVPDTIAQWIVKQKR